MNINRLVLSAMSLVRVNYIVILNNDLRKLIIGSNPNYRTKQNEDILNTMLFKITFSLSNKFFFLLIKVIQFFFY